MQLGRDGPQHLPAAFSTAEVAALTELLWLPPDRPGARLGAVPGLAALIAPAAAVAAAFLGPAARAVGARLFAKSAARNWAACCSCSIPPTACPAVSNGRFSADRSQTRAARAAGRFWPWFSVSPVYSGPVRKGRMP